ncbi:MAG: hypothetical protein IK027_00385, partial [Deltaproteobacteria bacterium]|nr:hypothetical protein [Deltaproteobacteria bacterium]
MYPGRKIMAITIDLSNVNLSLEQFQEIASGKYNAGEVRLTSATTLGKINNHVHRTGKNTVTLTHAEVIAIKDAFVRALSANGVDAEAVNRVRRELGLAPDGVTDTSLKKRSVRPLSRQQIREILDSNANAINQHAGPGTIRTDAEIHADYTDREKTALRTKRDTTNAALSGSRPLFQNDKISRFQAVVAGDVDFRSAEERSELLEMARRQKARILERSNGRPSNALNATLSYRPDNNGPTVEMPLGMSEAAYVDKLDDMILR